MLLDLGLPDINGFEVMDYLRPRIESKEIAVIIVTADSELASAAKAVDRGAYDYVVKPFDATRLLTTLSNAQGMLRMQDEVRKKSGGTLLSALGPTVPTSLANGIVLAASRNQAPVYLVGQDRDAKQKIAQAIHDQSRRAKSPFIQLDCSRFSRSELAREIFGDVRSTIPGALGRAEEGTLYLDTISCLPLSTQKLLVHFLTTQNYHKVGETGWRKSGCRLIFGSARELKEEMADGHFFLGVLYFHLCATPLFVPDSVAENARDESDAQGAG